MKAVIYGSRRQQDYASQIRRLVLELVMDGMDVFMHEKLYDFLVSDAGMTLPGVHRVFACRDDADLAVSIGGDGTLLRTVAWLGNRDIPLLGINTGHLGYLTAMTLDEALAGTGRIAALDFRRESLSMLAVTAEGLNGSPMALNEVVVAKEDSSSMITANVRINGSEPTEYRADGLIISTPTGSTAYNLSVGGPIVQPDAPVWVLSPIAAHTLTLRPIVVSDDAEISVEVNGRGSKFRVVVDGRATSMPMGSRITVKRAQHRVEVLLPHDRDFMNIIGTKLLFNG